MHDVFHHREGGLPLVLIPNSDASRSAEALAEGIRRNARDLKALLNREGAVLFRGYDVREAGEFHVIAETMISESFDYTLGDSPRSRVSDGVFTSTDYPREYPINLHQEMSYSAVKPDLLAFFCRLPASTGGATPLGDFRKILEYLPEELIERFSASRLRYRRTLHGGRGLGKSWMETFNTTDRARVEQILLGIQASFAWRVDGSLRIEEVVPGIASHPVTGETVWFNQAEQWHPSSMDPEVLELMLELSPVEDFPHFVEFENGDPLRLSDIQLIRDAQDAVTRRFTWERGDVLFVDNYLVAHGRDPYDGDRSVMVSLGR